MVDRTLPRPRPAAPLRAARIGLLCAGGLALYVWAAASLAAEIMR